MYFNAETQARDPAPVPLRARPTRACFPGQVGDAAHPRRPVRARRPQAAAVPQGRRRRLRDRVRVMATVVSASAPATGYGARRCASSAFDAHARRAGGRRPRRDARVWPTRVRARLLASAPSDIGRRCSDLELSYRPVELRAHIDADRRRTASRSRSRAVTWRSPAGRRAHPRRPDGAGRRPTASCWATAVELSATRRTPCGSRRARAQSGASSRGLRGAAVDGRGARDDQRGAPVDQRGARDDQRGAPVDQRGARDHERGAPVDQRGARDDERRAAPADLRAQRGQRVPRDDPDQHRAGRRRARPAPARAAVERPRRASCGGCAPRRSRAGTCSGSTSGSPSSSCGRCCSRV